MRTYCMYGTGNYSNFCVVLKQEGDSNKKGYMCVHTADSLSYAVATNNIIKQLYSSKNYFCKEKNKS